MLAYIPARGGSKRIPRKNIRSLGGRPILARTIDTLRQLTFVEQVFVSTDDADIARVAQDAGAGYLGPRAEELSGDKPGFIDLIHRDMERHADAAGGIREILFVLATAALVPASVYRDAYRLYGEKRPDVLMSCERFHQSPYWAMKQKADGYWEPIFPEKVFVNSQDLPPTLIDAGLFYFFNLDRMREFESLKIVDRLLAFEVAESYAVDVDTPADWQRLERRYAEQQHHNAT